MKMKHIKTATELLVKIGYADYWISTSNGDTIVGYAVCWGVADGDEWYDDEREYVSLFDPLGDGIGQAHALEDHFAWNEEELWQESERHSMRPLSAGQYSLYGRRLDRIKYCVKELTKRQKT